MNGKRSLAGFKYVLQQCHRYSQHILTKRPTKKEMQINFV